jgi:hypothetical protein
MLPTAAMSCRTGRATSRTPPRPPLGEGCAPDQHQDRQATAQTPSPSSCARSWRTALAGTWSPDAAVASSSAQGGGERRALGAARHPRGQFWRRASRLQASRGIGVAVGATPVSNRRCWLATGAPARASKSVRRRAGQRRGPPGQAPVPRRARRGRTRRARPPKATSATTPITTSRVNASVSKAARRSSTKPGPGGAAGRSAAPRPPRRPGGSAGTRSRHSRGRGEGAVLRRWASSGSSRRSCASEGVEGISVTDVPGVAAWISDRSHPPRRVSDARLAAAELAP